MTILLLVLLIIAMTVGMGWRQGAIRAAFSFAGILFGALLAVPLAPLIRWMLSVVGLKHPVLLWFIGPAIMFLIILFLFKIAGATVHRKVDVFYKYRAGDLRLALWSRLNEKLGLCVGFLNGAAYVILASFVIYIFSYWTVQTAAPKGNPWTLRLLNQLGRDLQSTGLLKAARAIDGMPESYYQAADIAGVAYHTPLVQARLYRYPAFLGLAERPELQELLNDNSFNEAWLRQESITVLLQHPRVKAVIRNPALMKAVWAAVEPNLQDLLGFLKDAASVQYTERILGRWRFDMNGAAALARKAKPSITSAEMLQLKRWMSTAFTRAAFIAMPDQQAVLKNIPAAVFGGSHPAGESQTVPGQWKSADQGYVLSVTVDGKAAELTVEVRNDQLNITGSAIPIAFAREL